MDNELDGRLRRLEAGLEQQHELLDRQATQQDRTYRLVLELKQLMTAPEPEGLPLGVLLAQLVDGINNSNAIAGQTLTAIETLAPSQRTMP